MSLFGGVEVTGHPSLENIRRLDLLPIPMIRRCQRLGFAIDKDYFAGLSSQFSSEMRELERDITNYIPPGRLREFSDKIIQVEDAEGEVAINANSAEQVGKLLFEMLGIGEGKNLKRTKKGRISTAKTQLRELELEHPAVRLVLDFKERSKLKSTYTDGLPRKAKFHPRGSCCPVCELPHDADTWRVHGEATTTRAETGRIQIKNPPLQTIPQRTELGAAVRAGFVASPGKRLVSVDFSQIELRMMAHLANCQSMIDVYERDGDIHMETAMQCFEISDPEKVDKVSHRIPAKTASFLCMYGGSGPALHKQLLMAFMILISEKKLDRVPSWLTVEWCDEFVRTWFAKRPEVEEYLDLQAYRARRYGMVWDIFGRVRLVPEVRSCHRWIKEAGVRQAGNMADQGSSAGLMKLSMASVEEGLLQMLEMGAWCWPLLVVHDQLIVEADEDVAEDVLEMMTAKFDSVMDDQDTGERMFRVPIKSDGEIMERWKKG